MGRNCISGGSTSTNNNTGTGTTGQPPVSGGFIPVMPSYTPISSVSVSGTATVGQTLSTVLSPASAVAAYQWQRSPSSDGTYADIQNATSGTYTLTASDADYYIRVRVTGTGLYTGTLNSNPSSLVKQKTYTVTFKDWDGKTLDTQIVEQGKNASAPSALSRPGYTFDGWDKAYANISSDITVIAKYSINSYTITFDSDGGSSVSSIIQDYGTEITPPIAPVKEGYVFAGWDISIPTTMPANDMSLKALWTAGQYTITFNSNGGTPVQSITKDFSTAVEKPTDPTKTGYTFAGWTPSIPNTMPAGNITVTAQWQINNYTLAYTAGENGTLTGEASQSVDYMSSGTAVTAVPGIGYHL